MLVSIPCLPLLPHPCSLAPLSPHPCLPHDTDIHLGHVCSMVWIAPSSFLHHRMF